MAKKFKAAVIGGSGYGGAEIIRRLLLHPDVDLVRVASIDYVGEPLSAAHFSLEGATSLRFEDLSAADAAKGMDVVLLGLPHKVAAHKVKEILPTGARIIDLSGDFRLTDMDAYEKFYGAKHPCPEVQPQFVYGLPELNRTAISKARYIASPGCFATTIELALLPLARGGFLTHSVETVAITGSSGSGVAPAATTHHPIRANNLRTYKPLSHQHLPEIVQTLEHAGAQRLDLRFVPVSAPLVRGLFATCFTEVPAKVTPDELAALYTETYRNAAFVRIPERRLPESNAVLGSNYAEVKIQAGPVVGANRSVVIFSALDNLIKGGAGQAIQSMNIMLGLPEKASLEDVGPWP